MHVPEWADASFAGTKVIQDTQKHFATEVFTENCKHTCNFHFPASYTESNSTKTCKM
jgi:hypothetical protein